MRPLSELDPHGIEGLLFDIDGTLTSAGRLTAEAYASMDALRVAGKRLVAITGRPAGWCDHIARMWPLDAVVGENGAFYFWYDVRARRLGKRYFDADAVRREKLGRLEAIATKILAAVPGCAPASDQAYRETDLAIDFCEDVPALPLEAAERIAALMREAGLSAKISSIHVNGWLGGYDKLSMTKMLFNERFGLDLDAVNARYAFAGDSPNDAPMFGFFENSVGVANVARFAGRLAAEPKFITPGESGRGFAELAARLLMPA